MTNPYPIPTQVEVESVDTPEFQSLIDELCGAATDSWACGGDFGTSSKRGAAQAAIVAHIASLVAAARQEALEKAAQACDDLHHKWRWDNEPDSDSGPRSCARAIRALAASQAAPSAGVIETIIEGCRCIQGQCCPVCDPDLLEKPDEKQ